MNIKKMFLLLIVIWSFNAKAIINGEKVDPKSFLFHASLHFGEDNLFNCGGSVLNDLFILTAAHCVEGENEENIKVLVNVFEDRKIKINEFKEVKKIHFYDNYNKEHNENGLLVYLGLKEKQKDLVLGDIAVIELKHPIKDNIESINISTYNKKLSLYTIGKGSIQNSDQLTLESQYGNQENIEHLLYVTRAKPVLRGVKLNHDLEDEHCESKLIICTTNYDKKLKIYTGIGNGDSGSALLSYDKEKDTYSQIGITSFGRNLYNTKESFGAFTSIEKHLEFLNPFIKLGKPLKFDESKGYNDFKSVGDGLTEDEAEKHFDDLIIKSNRIKFIIFIFGLLCFTTFIIVSYILLKGREIGREIEREKEREKTKYLENDFKVSIDYKIN